MGGCAPDRHHPAADRLRWRGTRHLPIFLLNPEYVADVGADGTAIDGLQAPVSAEAMVAERSRRLVRD
jgi:hypothetical protein